MIKIDFKKAEENGWSRWTKGNFDRLYLNIEKSGVVEVERYNSGNISYAALNGEKISHARASIILGTKVYYDIKKDELFMNGTQEVDTIKEIATKALKNIEL